MYPNTLHEYECEQASYSYLVSLLATVAGMPLPFVNIIATGIFPLAQKQESRFVRWHSMQALISQIPQFFINSALFAWSVSILMGETLVSSCYFGFLFTVLIFNIIDFIATLHTLIAVRKGKHVEWYTYAAITNLICPKP